MFTVYDKENQPVKVYDVQRDKNGYPQFLIRQGNQWIYRSAKHYSTEQKRDIRNAMCRHQWVEIGSTYDQKNGLFHKNYECLKCGIIKEV